MLKFQKKIRPPGQPRLPPGFLRPGLKIKILLPTFCLPRCPNSKKVGHDPPASKPPEEIDLAEICGPRGPGHLPKNYLQGVKWALKLLRQTV